MSKYEHDVEQELDDSFYPRTISRPKKNGKVHERLDAEEFLKQMMKEVRPSTKQFYQDFMGGSRVWKWALSLPGGTPVEGEIVVPMDQGEHPDIIMKSVFEKLFPMVKVQHAGGPRFTATFEGRVLGKFDVEADRGYIDKYTGSRVEVDMWGRPRHYEDDIRRANRQWENLAQGWLRQNLSLKIQGLDKYHPPYEERRSQAYKDARAKDDLFRQMATQAISRPAKPKDPWRPVNEGAQDMAKGGVNLSVSSGGGRGVTNMAHSTQMDQTSIAGQRVEQIGAAGRIHRMDQEGTVIG